jgi:hypothetical protein
MREARLAHGEPMRTMPAVASDGPERTGLTTRSSLRRVFTTASLLGLLCPLLQQPAALVLDAGPLQLELQPGRTAHLFHVVDQISQWDQYCHRQYLGPFTDQDGKLADADLAMLRRHVAVRGRHGWGAGLEQTFYVPADLATALADGVKERRLTAAEADEERAVFEHFAARIDALRQQEQPRLDAFRKRLQEELPRLREFADRLQRFCGTGRVSVPVFLLANPHDRDFGGGFNGGRLTLEIPRNYDAMPSFLHECMHAFLNQKEAQITRLIPAGAELDWQTLNEGIAHALAPGLFVPAGTEDPLREDVAQDFARRLGLQNGLVRFRRFGLALRPLLREALDDPKSSVESFVPRAVDAWRVIRELDAATRRPR